MQNILEFQVPLMFNIKLKNELERVLYDTLLYYVNVQQNNTLEINKISTLYYFRFFAHFII